MGVAIVVDGTSDLDAAVLNQFISGDGVKINIEINYAHIRYNGAAWEVVSTTDSCDIESGDLAWDTDHLEVTIAGYTNIPVAVACPVSATTTPARLVQVDPISTTQIDIYFFDYSAPPVVDTTESTDMDAMLILIGV